ncbi:TlyA family RNA methyltransferase [Pseudorhodoferax sp.]|uniref:TlyA family RNA methyltransferase n=1 Tax=Pseudorhodoferax sp. TaxID=1993553 RepID=UPI0039E6D5D6
MRADQLLVERGRAASRAQAQRLIAAGVQWRLPEGAWRRVAKNGEELPAAAELQLEDDAETRYVSRGGLKLEAALRLAGVDARGRICLDVGQSTGGFTDCLLQHGAARVVGVDVGHGQLHGRLRGDVRVTALEGVNARALAAADLGGALPAGGFDLVVGDLSFISLTLVLPALAPLLAAGGTMLLLAKPQFELQPGRIGKGGIVRDAAAYGEVQDKLRACAGALGLAVAGWYDSPILGGDGNREFLMVLRTT